MSAKNLVASAGLACLLAFGTCGCSFSASSTVETSTSTTDENGTTTTTTTTTTTETSTSDASKDVTISDWEHAWTGTTSKGFKVLYAESPTGEEAFLMLVNEENGEFESFVGKTENLEGDLVKIDANDVTFTFGISKVSDDLSTVSLDFGDEYGTADLTKLSIDELIADVEEIDKDGKVLS